MLNIKQVLFIAFALMSMAAFVELLSSFVAHGLDVNRVVFLILTAIAVLAIIGVCATSVMMFHETKQQKFDRIARNAAKRF